jgi:hypothetical protein
LVDVARERDPDTAGIVTPHRKPAMLPAPTPQRPTALVSYARMLIRAQRRFHALNGAAPQPVNSATVLGFPQVDKTRLSPSRTL